MNVLTLEWIDRADYFRRLTSLVLGIREHPLHLAGMFQTSTMYLPCRRRLSPEGHLAHGGK